MTTPTRGYVFAAARAGWGTVLVLWPDLVIRVASGQPSTTASRVVSRILGGRQLIQAAAILRWHSRTARDLSLTTDLLHAGTGLGLALLSTKWRRGALVDAAIATAFAATSARSPS
jgi:hypothetical protein